MFRASRLLLVCYGFVFGCLGREGRLAELPSKRLTVGVSDTGVFTASLAYAPRPRCYRIGLDIRARANDFKMDLLEQGDVIIGTDTNDPCRFPLWESPAIPVTSTTTVTLQDNSGSVQASFVDLFAERTLTLSGSGSAAPGDELRLVWQPTTDLYDPNTVQAVFARENEQAFTVAKGSPAISVEQGALVMRLPANTPKGPGKLVLVGLAQVKSVDCIGVDSCIAEYRVPFVHELTVN